MTGEFLTLIESHPAVCLGPDGCVRTGDPRPLAVLPGSFNPLHHGHMTLAAAAAARLGAAVEFELSIANVDKPPLDPEEITRRIAQFAGVASIWVTRAATFLHKADLFPGAAFVVGFDTAVRLVDPKYYRGDPALRDAALHSLHVRGCRIVIGGRADAAGRFRTWEAATIDPAFTDLFLPLTETDFRADVSSTALREERGSS